jgi:hypothetical protein
MRGKLFRVISDQIGRKWNGHGKVPEFTEFPLPAGSVLKCVMVSRFGDCGLTNDLGAESGYILRLYPEDLEEADDAER